MQSDFTRRLIN